MNPLMKVKNTKGQRCCVYRCKSDTVRDRGISFHIFPKNPELRRIWISRVNETSPHGLFSSWTPTKYHKICGKHFNKSGKKRKEDKLPMFFANRDYSLSLNFIAPNLGQNEVIIDNNYCEPEEESLHISEAVYVKTESENFIETAKIYDALQDHNYSIPDAHNLTQLVSTIKKLKDEVHELNEKLSSFKNKEATIKSLQNEIAVLKMQVAQQSKTIIENNSRINSLTTRRKSPKPDLIRSPIKLKNNKIVRYYTGFKSKERFQNFVEFMSEPYNMKAKITNWGRPHKLSLEDEALIILSRLRLGWSEKEIALRFKVSQSTVSHITIFWIDLLSTSLSSYFNMWPSRTFVEATMSKIFESYSTTRIIMDCVKLPSQNDYSRFTSFKSRNTRKSLIAISPNGYISFISELFDVTTSDEEIFHKSGLLTQLESGDSVMADEGFRGIHSDLSRIGVELHIPHASGKFSEEADVAKLRTYVEQVFAEIKRWKILKNISSIVSTNLSYINKVWKVCCYLQNFVENPLLWGTKKQKVKSARCN